MGDTKDQIFGKVTEDMDFDRFRELEGRVSRVQRDFISQGEIQHVDDLEATAIKLRTFADRLRTAPRGYAGMFDAVKINEEELSRLYEYDAAMLDLVDEVSHAIDNVESSVGSDGLPAAIRNLENKAQACVEAYDRREAVVLGIQ